MKYLNQSFGVCMAGNCSGCHLQSICNQPCPYVDGHLEEFIEATCLKFKCCIEELKAHMGQKGYKKLDEFRGNVSDTWLKGVL